MVTILDVWHLSFMSPYRCNLLKVAPFLLIALWAQPCVSRILSWLLPLCFFTYCCLPPGALVTRDTCWAMLVRSTCVRSCRSRATSRDTSFKSCSNPPKVPSKSTITCWGSFSPQLSIYTYQVVPWTSVADLWHSLSAKFLRGSRAMPSMWALARILGSFDRLALFIQVKLRPAGGAQSDGRNVKEDACVTLGSTGQIGLEPCQL